MKYQLLGDGYFYVAARTWPREAGKLDLRKDLGITSEEAQRLQRMQTERKRGA